MKLVFSKRRNQSERILAVKALSHQHIKSIVIGHGAEKTNLLSKISNWRRILKWRLVISWVPIDGDAGHLQDDGTQGKQRPRVRPIVPKQETVVCQICMGRIKKGLLVARCECGKQFHDVCLVRTGFCPYCQQIHTAETVSKISTLMIPTPKEMVQCPSCARMIDADSTRCECGAVFVNDDHFECISCSSLISIDTLECGHCGQKYHIYEPVRCPVCGGIFNDEEGRCACGAFTGDVCPECGVLIDENDSACPSCGTVFEQVSIAATAKWNEHGVSP